VGKTMSARDMLQAGRRPTNSPREQPNADAADPPPGDSGTSRLVDSAPSDSATSQLGDSSTSDSATSQVEHSFTSHSASSHLGNESGATSGLLDQASATSPLVTQSYQRGTFFLTPGQRRWLKDMAHDLPSGLSASDIVRLAVSRLRSQIEAGGVDLVDALVAQAHAEAETHPGRRNRGLPARHYSTHTVD
jgi:hypothetical protein